MKRILVCDDAHCKYLAFTCMTSYKDYQFYPKENGIQIIYEKDVYFLENLKSLKIKETTFISLESNWVWSIMKYQDVLTIGRDYQNTLTTISPSISNFHAKIEHGILTDLESTNGTYVNGERVTRLQLHDCDCIWIVDLCLIYFDSFIVINKKRTSERIKPKEIKEETFTLQPQTNLPIISRESITIEAFVLDGNVKKQGLFQSIGSSILILFSSCVSLGIMYVLNPQQITQLISMVLMSVSMSLSFLIFGLYSRNQNYRDQIKDIENHREMYKQYLNSLQNTISNQKDTLQQQLSSIHTECVDLNQSFLKYSTCLMGYQKNTWLDLIYKNPGYQHIEHPLHQYVIDWIHKQETIILEPIWFEEQKIYWIDISSNIDVFINIFMRIENSSLFHYCLWVCKEELPIYSHPLCTYQNHRLWIHDEKSYQILQPICDEKMIYIITDYELFNQIHLPVKSAIFIGNKKPNLECIHIQDNVFPFIDLKRYRNHRMYYMDALKEKEYHPYFIQQKNSSFSLEACIGLDENGEEIWIDFSEKGQGPHGLIAGSTGSGKSECMASLLMQLVLKNDADHFQFLLIDFKGGALGNIFKAFPHFKGMVTNLEKKDIQRFLITLDTIIEQRQLLLSTFQMQYPNLPNHIDTYNQFFKPPISHLFLVVDELAQLKTQYPEVISKLKDIARIGRSLGIHLILSTQKPFGVVDDQIWANSTYQICLRVMNVQDSKEILHNDLAAYLEEVGQFIFQSGLTIQKMGTCLYLHQIIDSSMYTEVDCYDEPIYKQEKITILDKILNEQKSFMKEYLIQPPLKEYAWNQEKIVYDDVYNHKQPEFIISFGQTVSIMSYEIKKITNILTSFYQDMPIFAYQLPLYKKVDAVFMSLNEVEVLHRYHGKMTILVYIENLEDLMYWKDYFQESNIRLIVCIDQFESSYLKLLSRVSIKMHYQWNDKEWFYLYYANMDNYKQAFALDKGVSIQNRIYEMEWNETKPIESILKCRVDFEKDTRIHLGFDKNHQNVYLDETSPLLICYVQKSKESWIQNLVNSMKNKRIVQSFEDEFDVCILNLIEDLSSLQSKGFLMKQFDIDILWVGQGFQEYGYGIKRKCFELSNYDMIYWRKQECVLISEGIL